MDKKQWLDAECAKVFRDAAAKKPHAINCECQVCFGRAFKNEQLSKLLYETASQPLRLWPEFALPPSPWYARLWWRIKAKLPRVHFGPCDHEGCDGY